MTQRKSTKLLSLILALLMAFMLLWTALPAQAEENVDALGPVTSKDVIYQITCGMDVASFYSGKSYSFADFRNCYEDHSNENPPYVKYLWKTPAGYTFVADNAPSGKNEADTIAYIKRYIDQGIPPICHCLPVTGNQHWVVPFKYTSGSGWDSIWVLDPYLGVERTMAEAMRVSCGGTSGGVDRIMHHPSYSLT